MLFPPSQPSTTKPKIGSSREVPHLCAHDDPLICDECKVYWGKIRLKGTFDFEKGEWKWDKLCPPPVEEWHRPVKTKLKFSRVHNQTLQEQMEEFRQRYNLPPLSSTAVTTLMTCTSVGLHPGGIPSLSAEMETEKQSLPSIENTSSLDQTFVSGLREN